MLFLNLLFCLFGHNGITAYEVGECGIKYDDFTPSLSYGEVSKINKFPWHVGLYKMDNTSKYQYICGGSIIDSDIVITAAHCVYDEEHEDIDYSRMAVAAGKHNVSWEHRDVHEQRLEVISKKIPSSYRGFFNRYQDDIAVLALNDSIKFSSLVMPICINWGRSYEPSEEETGTLIGWSFSKNNSLDVELDVTQMQLQNFGECRNNMSKGYTFFLTSDKFCAIKKNNSSEKKDTTGSALIFSKKLGVNETSRYFIKGILSSKDVQENKYLFTNISSHLPWVNSTVREIIAHAGLRKGLHD